MIESAVIVLPLPLSPTMPRISPLLRRSKSTPSSTLTRARRRAGTRCVRSVDLEERAASAHRRLGSRRSRRPSPIRLKPITATAIASPGKNETHHSPETICSMPERDHHAPLGRRQVDAEADEAEARPRRGSRSRTGASTGRRSAPTCSAGGASAGSRSGVGADRRAPRSRTGSARRRGSSGASAGRRPGR